MQDRPEETGFDNPLRHLTPAEFMALGNNAVVYVRPISGKQLAEFMPEPDFTDEAELQLVVSADGSPLMVADSEDAVQEWLDARNFGIVTLQ